MNDTALTRRHFFADIGAGLSGIALASLLGRSEALADGAPKPDLNGGVHHRARASASSSYS